MKERNEEGRGEERRDDSSDELASATLFVPFPLFEDGKAKVAGSGTHKKRGAQLLLCTGRRRKDREEDGRGGEEEEE